MATSPTQAPRPHGQAGDPGNASNLDDAFAGNAAQAALAPGSLGLFSDALWFNANAMQAQAMMSSAAPAAAGSPAAAASSASAVATLPAFGSQAGISWTGIAAPSFGSVAASLGSTPSWISTLTDKTIKADMTAAASDGSFTYSEALKVMQDLYGENLSGNARLSTTQFSDLRTIASNLNVGMTTNAYVADITTALVDGNPGNAYWTGGAASAVKLGNLGVGSTETQLSELIGKWFLGSDRPSSTVLGDGAGTISYRVGSAPLFGAGGPSINDVNQGGLGDCYLLSSLAEVAKNDPSLVQSMITSNGNGSYGVRFYVNGQQDWVTVDSAEAYEGGGLLGNDRYAPATTSWVDLVEKAYAQLNGQGIYVGAAHTNYGNSFTSMGNGGWDATVLNVLTDTAVRSYRASTSLLSTIVSALGAHDDITLDSWSNTYDASGRQNLVSSHAMSVTGYDAATGNLVIRNPWGAVSWQYWNTSFEVSLSTLAAAGDQISIDNVGSLIGGPQLANQTANQVWVPGRSVSFSLASNTFTDSQGQRMTYAATQANGAALPAWLRFNPSNATFTGTPPAGAANLSITVTATDGSGKSASETFAAAIAKPPVLANQTPNLFWAPGHALSSSLASNTFTDPQGAGLTYTAKLANGQPLPTWLQFNPATLAFTGTPPANASGNQAIVVTATDSYGLSTSETFTAVQARPPVLANQTAAQSWAVGRADSFSLAANTFSDPQNAGLTYTAVQANGQPLPSWLQFNSATGTFTGTPPASAANLSIKVTATDSYGLSASDTFAVNFLKPPVLANQTAAQTWAVGKADSFTLAANTFSDPQGSKLTYSASLASGQPLPAWLQFNAATGTFTGTPPANASNLSIKVTATDGYGMSASDTFTVNTVKPPVLANQTANFLWAPGHAINATLAANTFTDPQGGKLAYAATMANGQPLPSWLKFDPATLSFTGTPPASAASAGNQSIKVTATDAYGLSTSETFTAIKASAPVVAQPTPNLLWSPGHAINATLSANTFTDPEGTKLTYAASLANGQPLPAWLKFDPNTRTFTGMPPASAASAGNQVIKVTATDAYGLSASETFTAVEAKAAAAPSPVAAVPPVIDLRFSSTQGLAAASSSPLPPTRPPSGTLVSR